jgi:hypothetical protein
LDSSLLIARYREEYAMIGPKLISVALLLVTAGSITNGASAITAEIAKKCEVLTAKAFPPRVIGNPAAGSEKGSGKDAQAYFNKCVKSGGKVDDGGSNEAKWQTPSPPDAKVYFINLNNGAELDSPFLVQFGLSGMGVAPAGIETPNTGHHHLIIDTKLTPEELKQPIPADDHHLHFRAGQTEAMVTLPKGKHTLQLVLGDWTHIPHVPPVMSDVIGVTVR